jgi:hypothetical protein
MNHRTDAIRLIVAFRICIHVVGQLKIPWGSNDQEVELGYVHELVQQLQKKVFAQLQ